METHVFLKQITIIIFLNSNIYTKQKGVGKSCILSQFTEGRFKKEHDATIGVEFGSKNMLIGDTVIKI